MRICRAAGLVILVSSWARLGSGNRPFLLLRIWRIQKHTHQSEEERLTPFLRPPGAPDDDMNYYTSLHQRGLSALPAEMWGRGAEIPLQRSIFTEKCFHLCCCQRCSRMCEHTHQHSQMSVSRLAFADSAAPSAYVNQPTENFHESPSKSNCSTFNLNISV